MLDTIYDTAFYDRQREGSKRSAEIIVPLIMDLIKPKSVVDVGCGLGTWLSAFHDQGVCQILGIDGGYVDRTRLLISEDCFIEHDLTMKLDLDARYDLVMCLEVAEHLPEDRAERLVDSLTQLGDLILFSAAHPFQGGAGHINEQWLDYWTELFFSRGFNAVDIIRFRVWNNPNVQWWYAQNMLLYANKHAITKYPLLKIEQELSAANPQRLIHPTKYLLDVDPNNISIKRAIRYLNLALRRKLLNIISSRKK